MQRVGVCVCKEIMADTFVCNIYLSANFGELGKYYRGFLFLDSV